MYHNISLHFESFVQSLSMLVTNRKTCIKLIIFGSLLKENYLVSNAIISIYSYLCERDRERKRAKERCSYDSNASTNNLQF